MPAVTALRTRRWAPPRLRSGRLATLVTTALVLAVTPVITAGPASATVPNPVLNCQPETHPAAGTPRNSPGVPYQAPFASTLNGGYLAIHVPNHLGVTFGIPEPGYPNGTLFGEACGRFGLPSLSGSITDPHPGAGSLPDDNNPDYNHNFILHGPTPGATPPPPGFPVCTLRYTTYTALNPTTSGCDVNAPVPVGLTLQGTGLPVLDGYGSADGVINAAIVSQAANGGLNVTFSNTAKATAVLDPAQLLNIFSNIATSVLSSLSPALQSILGQLQTGLSKAAGAAQGGECTLAVGDLSQTGLPGAPATPPVHLTTDVPSPNGAPVTGPVSAGIRPINPVTAGSAVAYANDFPAAAINPNMPPDPGAPGAGTTPPATLCNPVVAELFNVALGLPASAPNVTFRAPVGFSAHAPF